MISEPVAENTSDPQSILIVDDEVQTSSLLRIQLQRQGYKVIAVNNGAEALEYVRIEGLPSLAIIDIMMPGMDGFVLADELASVGELPIIFLSALSDTATKVEGISKFAEDYVTKPFVFSELLARVKRILTHAASRHMVAPEVVIDQRLKINFAQQTVIVNDQPVTLTPSENRLLHILYKYRGRILSPTFIVETAWDATRKRSIDSLYVHMRRLRSKIEPDPENPRYITTVPGRGYSLLRTTNDIMPPDPSGLLTERAIA